MLELGILLVIVVVVAAFLIYPGWRDKRILKTPFSPQWQEIVERRLPFFYKLSNSEQCQLLEMIRLFVAKKQFHGCAELVISDEIRITIASEACLLLLNRGTGVYPSLQHILVYPAAFQTEQLQNHQNGTVSQKSIGVLGQSWSNGKVILSWDDVEHGVENFSDGHNVVLHEFSHQLDSESGSTNGAPRLKKNSYPVWAEVLSEEYSELVKVAEKHGKSVMDYYGATNPAEFFAVATETFFEKPLKMFEKHPELFEELRTYYCVDPRQWL